jgi:hypothetical protein
VKGSRETTGEGEGIAQIPNRRRKISDTTVKEKAVGKRLRASVKSDVVAPKEKNLNWGQFIYVEDRLRQVFREDFLLDIEVNLVIYCFMGCGGFVAIKVTRQ